MSKARNQEQQKTTNCVLHEPAAHSLTDCLKELKFGRPGHEQLIIDELVNVVTSRLGDEGFGWSSDVIGEVFNK
jgi:hypothetical protein